MAEPTFTARPKTLGQIAHEAGESAGGWQRRWHNLQDRQKLEWEEIADVVAKHVREQCAQIADDAALHSVPDDFALDALVSVATRIRGDVDSAILDQQGGTQ